MLATDEATPRLTKLNCTIVSHSATSILLMKTKEETNKKKQAYRDKRQVRNYRRSSFVLGLQDRDQ